MFERSDAPDNRTVFTANHENAQTRDHVWHCVSVDPYAPEGGSGDREDATKGRNARVGALTIREEGSPSDGMRTLATNMMLEHLGYDVGAPTDQEIEAIELCASMAWVCAIVVEVSCGGLETLEKLANPRNGRAVALISALIDGGEDTLRAAAEEMHGCDTTALCYEFIDTSRAIGRIAAPRREEAKLALLTM